MNSLALCDASEGFTDFKNHLSWVEQMQTRVRRSVESFTRFRASVEAMATSTRQMERAFSRSIRRCVPPACLRTFFEGTAEELPRGIP